MGAVVIYSIQKGWDVGSIGLVLSVGASLWFGIHWGVILGAIFTGVIAGLITAKPTSSFQPTRGQILDFILMVSYWVYPVIIWAVFGWQSALSSVFIGWFSCSGGRYIVFRILSKSHPMVRLERAIRDSPERPVSMDEPDDEDQESIEKPDDEGKFDWQALAGLVVVGYVFTFWGPWWGIPALIVCFVLLGWSKRHDGPFPTDKD